MLDVQTQPHADPGNATLYSSYPPTLYLFLFCFQSCRRVLETISPLFQPHSCFPSISHSTIPIRMTSSLPQYLTVMPRPSFSSPLCISLPPSSLLVPAFFLHSSFPSHLGVGRTRSRKCHLNTKEQHKQPSAAVPVGQPEAEQLPQHCYLATPFHRACTRIR